MEWFNALIGLLGVGSAGGLLLFAALVGIAVGALLLTRRGKGGKALDLLLDLAKTAVLAVEKLADNGQFDGLSPLEKSRAKKEMALKFIEDALKANGMQPSPLLMGLAGMAIEAVLKQLERE